MIETPGEAASPRYDTISDGCSEPPGWNYRNQSVDPTVEPLFLSPPIFSHAVAGAPVRGSPRNCGRDPWPCRRRVQDTDLWTWPFRIRGHRPNAWYSTLDLAHTVAYSLQMLRAQPKDMCTLPRQRTAVAASYLQGVAALRSSARRGPSGLRCQKRLSASPRSATGRPRSSGVQGRPPKASQTRASRVSQAS